MSTQPPDRLDLTADNVSKVNLTADEVNVMLDRGEPISRLDEALGNAEAAVSTKKVESFYIVIEIVP